MSVSLIKKIIDIMREAGKIPEKYTGKITLEINLSQGGVNEARLTVPETLR